MDVPDAVREIDTSQDGTESESGSRAPSDSSADSDLNPDGMDVEPESDEWDPWGWLKSVPEGSYRDADARDYWDPENGGKNRLAHHISDLAGVRGIPNGLGILLACAEIYWNLAQHQSEEEDSSADKDPDAGEYPEIEGAFT